MIFGVLFGALTLFERLIMLSRVLFVFADNFNTAGNKSEAADVQQGPQVSHQIVQQDQCAADK